MYSLHFARFCAISGFKFNSFMSSLTHSSHVFLGLSLQPFPSTLAFRQALTHSSPTIRSTCPDQRNLPLLTTSSTHSIPKPERKYSLLFLSDNFSPHILLTIHISLRSGLLASSSFTGQVSLSYTKTLCTQALYIFPFNFREVPLSARTGLRSLNFSQAHLTLVLAASFAPPCL